MEQDQESITTPDVVPIDEIIEEPFKEKESEETAIKPPVQPVASVPVPAPTPVTAAAPKPSEILKSSPDQPLAAPKPSEILSPVSGFVGRRAVIQRPKSRIALIFSIIFILLVAGFAAFFFFFYRVKITINTNPAPDKVVLDGKEVKPGTFNLMPGKHTIEVSKDGFVTFTDSRAFKVSENINLDFKLEPAKESTLLNQGGYFPVATRDQNYLVFVGANGQIFSKKSADANSTPIPLSNGTFPSVSQLLISNNGQFALVKDTEALKIVDFNKSDIINQSIAKLPPAISQVNSVTWNGNKSSFFPEENSEIVYDLKTDSGWRLYLANRAHTQADILATLDPDSFQNLYLDWNDSDRQVLLTGGEVGTIDLSTREYKTVSKDAKFIYGKWSPQGKSAAVIDDQGNLYRFKDGKLDKTNFKTKPDLISFTAANKLIIVTGSKPIEVDFDTLSSIDYAEIKGLEKARMVAVAKGIMYFADDSAIRFAQLAFSSYKQK